MDGVHEQGIPVPAGQCAPHDVTNVAFWFAADAVFMVLTTRDDLGAPSDNIVGEFAPEEALEILGKFAAVTRRAMEARDSMRADAVTTPRD